MIYEYNGNFYHSDFHVYRHEILTGKDGAYYHHLCQMLARHKENADTKVVYLRDLPVGSFALWLDPYLDTWLILIVNQDLRDTGFQSIASDQHGDLVFGPAIRHAHKFDSLFNTGKLVSNAHAYRLMRLITLRTRFEIQYQAKLHREYMRDHKTLAQ